MKTILNLFESCGLSHIDFAIPVTSPLGEITGASPHGFDLDYTSNAGGFNELDKEYLEAIALQISEEIDNINSGFIEWDEWG